MSQMHQGYPNNSLDPFSLGGSATFHQNSNTNSTPGDYKTAETQDSRGILPDFVVSCRNILLDRSFDLDCDEAEKDVALEGGKALTKSDSEPYDNTFVHVAERAHAKRKKDELGYE